MRFRTQGLTHPREQQVLALLAQGFSNKQIARRIGISEHGAKRHVTNLLAKLNSPNRTLAVALALQEGLV
ncbi:response regulator transcription factor [Streptomyces sanglieri]|uniref:Response regulator transcription factor n=1 Tax=Streptomyces sanglieri TaxID=193460 RepID=A0ABW2X288_9ACTN